MFDPKNIDLRILRKRAYNLRWANVPGDVIPLTAADPDFPCAPPIAEALTRFVNERYFCYGSPDGSPEFRESMAAYYRTRRQIPASPDLIFPVDSAAFGIYLTCQAFLQPGDEAIIFDPVDFLFRYAIEAVSAVAVTFPIPSGTGSSTSTISPDGSANPATASANPAIASANPTTAGANPATGRTNPATASPNPAPPLDVARLERLIYPKTRMICLCNPLNPTGKVFTRDELREIGRIAVRHNLIILSDEIWSDIVFTPHVYTSIASLEENIRTRTITITGFSKSYGLAGLRIGSVMTPNKKLYDRLMDASRHQSTVHGANILAQVAATAALNECGGWLQDFLQHLHAMRDLTVRRLNEIPGFSCIAPEGCYVAFADITGTGKTSTEIQELLFDKAKVAVVPGRKEWFGPGAEGHIRLCFATSEEILTTALERINKTITRL